MFEQGVKDRKLVKEMNSLVQGDVQSVMISGVQEKDSFTRVPCQPQPLIRAKGYWLGREWVSRDCSLGSTSQKKWWQCLTNRSLHFIGDSTVKQLHLYILHSAGIIKQVDYKDQQQASCEMCIENNTMPVFTLINTVCLGAHTTV